jgi:hypothetical protein
MIRIENSTRKMRLNEEMLIMKVRKRGKSPSLTMLPTLKAKNTSIW